MNHLFRQACREIEAARNIFLVTHYDPDGDAIASVCAMIEYLETSGKKYLAYCQSDLPDNLKFLPHSEKIKTSKDIKDIGATSFLDDFDLILIFDCAVSERTGVGSRLDGLFLGQKIIVFDHHPLPKNPQGIILRDPLASSTAEIIYYFFKSNKIIISRKAATCILAGIIADTDSFLYPSASLKTLKIGAEMLSIGASKNKIVEESLNKGNFSILKAWGNVLSGLTINKCYRLAVAVLTYEEHNKNNLAENVYEGLSGLLSNLGGVRAILFLRETKQGIVRGSLRTSRPGVDVSRLAEILGGGGHKKAAAFKIEGSLASNAGGYKVI